MYDSKRNQYDHYVIDREAPLLEWMLSALPGSKTKIKAILQGHGIKVDGKQTLLYERGWEVEPEDEASQLAYAVLIKQYN